MTIADVSRSALLLTALTLALAGHASPQLSEDLVRSYLWPASDAEFVRAAATLETDRSLVGITRQQMRRVEEWMRRGPTVDPPRGVGDALH